MGKRGFVVSVTEGGGERPNMVHEGRVPGWGTSEEKEERRGGIEDS